MTIDLRSDTVTKPTPAMLQAIMNAQVGDDVFEEDASVKMLEQKAAELFGHESALFCPSGTMTNQIAIKILTTPPGEVICESGSHVYYYEGGGIAFNSGLSVRLINGNRGRITADDILDNSNADNVHFPKTQLVVLENTCNRGGGSCYELSDLEKISAVCRNKNLKLHLDGARIFNAIIAKGYNPEQTGKLFDSISICLSKGLGAPVGSVLISSHKYIKNAKRIRKILGGGMRQAGYIAAAGIYALEKNIERLKEDHHRAKQIEEILKSVNYIAEVLPVETNIIVFKLKETIITEKFLNYLASKNIKAFSTGKQTIRFVTHLDFTDEMLKVLKKILLSDEVIG